MPIRRSLAVLSLLVAGVPACGADAGPAGGPAVGPSPGVGPRSAAACGDAIDHTADAPDGYRVVAGSVAVPTAERLLPVEPHSGDGPVRMFAKWGLLIRGTTSAALSLPPEWADRARLGWGGTDPATAVTVTACPPTDGDSEWTVFAGGTWVSEADCVPIQISAGRQRATVELSVGAPCSRPGG